MNEKTLLKLCVLLSFLGMVLIYLSIITYNPKIMRISNIKEDMVGEQVTICGEITKKTTTQKQTLFLELYNGSEITVVFFKDVVKSLNLYELSEKETICVQGTVDVYDNKLEVLGKKVI